MELCPVLHQPHVVHPGRYGERRRTIKLRCLKPCGCLIHAGGPEACKQLCRCLRAPSLSSLLFRGMQIHGVLKPASSWEIPASLQGSSGRWRLCSSEDSKKPLKCKKKKNKPQKEAPIVSKTRWCLCVSAVVRPWMGGFAAPGVILNEHAKHVFWGEKGEM